MTARVPARLRVAVAVASFDAAATIEAALESIAAQRRLPDEVFVVDDGSRDDTVAIARRWAARQSFPVTVLALEGGPSGGPARPLEAALRASSAELFATLDADDMLAPSHLARLAAALEARPDATIAFGDAAIFADDPETPYDTFIRGKGLPVHVDAVAADGFASLGADGVRSLVAGCFICTASSMLRRSAMLATGGWDQDVGHANDYAMYLKLAAVGEVVWTRELLGRRRVHEGALTAAAGGLSAIWPTLLALAATWARRDALALRAPERRAIVERFRTVRDAVRYTASLHGVRTLTAVTRALALQGPSPKDVARAVLRGRRARYVPRVTEALRRLAEVAAQGGNLPDVETIEQTAPPMVGARAAADTDVVDRVQSQGS